MPVSASRGTSAGASATSICDPEYASISPKRPATKASSKLSVTNWLTMRFRLAPSAARTAISRARAVALPSSSVAVFAHAIRSRTVTAPNKRYSIMRTLPTISSRSLVTATLRPLLVSGNCCSKRRAMVAISVCACLSGTPALSRPTARKFCPPRDPGSRTSDTQMSVLLGNRKPGGSTPTIGLESGQRTVCPSAWGSPPKWLCQ